MTGSLWPIRDNPLESARATVFPSAPVITAGQVVSPRPASQRDVCRRAGRCLCAINCGSAEEETRKGTAFTANSSAACLVPPPSDHQPALSHVPDEAGAHPTHKYRPRGGKSQCCFAKNRLQQEKNTSNQMRLVTFFCQRSRESWRWLAVFVFWTLTGKSSTAVWARQCVCRIS